MATAADASGQALKCYYMATMPCLIRLVPALACMSAASNDFCWFRHMDL